MQTLTFEQTCGTYGKKLKRVYAEYEIEFTGGTIWVELEEEDYENYKISSEIEEKLPKNWDFTGEYRNEREETKWEEIDENEYDELRCEW